MCSECANHSKFKNPHDKGGGDVYDHLMNNKIFTLIMNKIS